MSGFSFVTSARGARTCRRACGPSVVRGLEICRSDYLIRTHDIEMMRKDALRVRAHGAYRYANACAGSRFRAKCPLLGRPIFTGVALCFQRTHERMATVNQLLRKPRSSKPYKSA